MKVYQYLILLVLLILISCGQKKKKEETVPLSESGYLEKGRLISSRVQAELLMHVTGAVQTGGFSYAIGFCNLKALPLTDSLGAVYSCQVSRITDRNRNPLNRIREGSDQKIWEKANRKENQSVFQDTLVGEGQHIVYYRAISLAMPTCLNCHGTPGENITDETLAQIDSIYPADRARNYQLNDLRGLWKIDFNIED